MRIPRNATKIYDACLSLKIVNSGKKTTYEIPENKRAAIYGLKNGDLFICSQVGATLLPGKKKFRGFYTEIRARKGKESLWPDDLFKHVAKISSKGAVYVIGKDILIHSLINKELWRIFDYPNR